MADQFYPTVDIQFIEDHLLASGKIIPNSKISFGATTSFTSIGSQAIYKRIIILREIEPGQICYEQAAGVAIKYGFLGPLMSWLEENKDWKEGAYVDTDSQ